MGIITEEFLQGIAYQVMQPGELADTINTQITDQLTAKYHDSICPLPYCYDEETCKKLHHCQFIKSS